MIPTPQLRFQASTLIAGALCLVLSGFASAGEESVRKWLDRMSRAVDDLNYRGTMVYFRDGRVDTLRIIHRSDADGIRERIYSLDGQPREILRNGGKVKCYFPDNEALVVQSQLVSRMMPTLPVSRSGNPEVAYALKLAGTERVAGHIAQVLEISPRDEYRYGHKFWLEERTGMLLRSALLDTDGSVLQQLSFAEIELGARIEDSELEAGVSGDAVSTTATHLPSTRSPADRRPAWRAASLPSGFQLSSVEQSYSEDDAAFEHLVFSDGLATVSVYIERWEGAGEPTGSLENMGPVHVHTRHQDGIQITVVGEVPAETVRYISGQMQTSPRTIPRRRE